MKGTAFYAVIIAGGAGERLWPLSTPARPKQFLKIFGGKSLIRQALERVLPLVPVTPIMVISLAGWSNQLSPMTASARRLFSVTT